MFETTFILRQETPIIHFLHDQPDATLRATEVKPKLDNWILKKNPDLPKSWISKVADKGHQSLDYKISIRPRGAAQQVHLEAVENRDGKWETKAFPHLLGNMGGKEHKEDLKNLVLHQGAEIHIHTWHEGLFKVVQNELPQMVANNNFGNRSSKGFGSFSCLNDGKVAVKPNLKFCFDWTVEGNSIAAKQKDLFTAINWFYKCLRSGINQVNRDRKTEFYFKSLLFAFAESKGEKWDKYTIKNHFFKGGKLPENKVDYRDWLGLSTEESWGREYYNQKITKSGGTVERFASPIIFKPILLKDNLFKIYFDAVIEEDIKVKFSKSTIEVDNSGKPKLLLKPSSKFDFQEFFKFAFEKNIEEHLLEFDRDGINPTNHWIYKDFIHPIFSSIRKNLKTPA